MTGDLTRETAPRLARAALGHLGREFPHKLDHVMDGPGDARTPRELHPLFHGSFDWHSCVHGWWCVARLARCLPDLPEAAEIERRLDEAFTAQAVAGELAYLARPSARGFERPYGWAWALKLAEELGRRDDPAGRRRAALYAPLADAFAARLAAYLPLCTYPVRAGAHTNSASPWPWPTTSPGPRAAARSRRRSPGRWSAGTRTTATARPGSPARTTSSPPR